MKNLMTAVKRFVRDEEGVTAIEYGLIAALIAVVLVIALGNTGDALNTTFTNIATALGNAND